jgi:hypothetical protein
MPLELIDSPDSKCTGAYAEGRAGFGYMCVSLYCLVKVNVHVFFRHAELRAERPVITD